MVISIIVAMDRRGTIGRENGLPWRLSADLKHVKAITMGKPIIMGRKTHESIGRALPGRENIIITHNSDYKSPGCTVFTNIDDALEHCRYHEEVVIMGGAELYQQTLSRAARIYMTEVHAEVDGDTSFPRYKPDQWREVNREDYYKDDKNEYDYSFVVLDKIGKKNGLR